MIMPAKALELVKVELESKILVFKKSLMSVEVSLIIIKHS